MTVETKYYFGPGDVKALSFTCSHCSSVITVLLNGGREKPEEAAYKCGVCEKNWLSGKKLKLDRMQCLVSGLREFARDEDNGFTLAFQVRQLLRESVLGE